MNGNAVYQCAELVKLNGTEFRREQVVRIAVRRQRDYRLLAGKLFDEHALHVLRNIQRDDGCNRKRFLDHWCDWKAKLVPTGGDPLECVGFAEHQMLAVGPEAQMIERRVCEQGGWRERQ